MKKSLIFCLLFTSGLAASLPHSFQVDSMRSQGNDLILEGNFVYHHPLANFEAKSATARLKNGEKAVESITLQDGVVVELIEGGKLRAPFARFDADKMQIALFGNSLEEVSFIYPPHGTMSAEEVVVYMPEKLKQNASKIEKVVAKGEIKIQDDEGRTIRGESALLEEFDEKSSPHTMTLFSEKGDNSCTIEKEGAFHFTASKITLKPQDKTGMIENVEGELFQGCQLSVSSLQYDQNARQIDASKELKLHLFGEAHFKGTSRFTHDEKGQLIAMRSEGPSLFNFSFANENEKSRLENFGIVEILESDGKVTFASPSDSTGVKESEQVHFTHPLGEVYGDEAILFYDHIEKKLKPKKLIVEGNLRLIAKNPGGERYALAGRGEYDFDTGTLTLLKGKNESVLFYDELNHMEASAPEVVLFRDAKTGKECVQAKGRARFVLAEEELLELKKRFAL